MSFPKDFIWGVASSSYQIEGAAREDEKGTSIWDTFSRQPGAIFGGDNGDTACDAYHRFAEDLDEIQRMGVHAYRFSVSWPRVEPLGDGTVNPAGLAYYDRLVDGCLARGIEPYMTLYHWDLPQTLEDAGGWQNRQTAERFAHYCGVIAEHFRGRVQNYFTLNEPECSAFLGYATGEHAPGKKLPLPALFAVWHNLLLAHGLGYRVIREKDPDAKICLATTGRLCYPQNPASAADIEAARQATFALKDESAGFTHQLALDPVLLGHYPACQWPELRALLESAPAADLDIIHTGLDYLGLNIYNGNAVCAGKDGPAYVPKQPGCQRTACKWPVTPEVMEWGPRFLWERYQLPIFITENGLSCNDFVHLDGQVHDLDRIDFLTRYLRCLQTGVSGGVPVLGYFHWSATDNFEWSKGYSERFGLVYVDFTTQKRIPKDSAAWYAQTIATDGAKL